MGAQKLCTLLVCMVDLKTRGHLLVMGAFLNLPGVSRHCAGLRDPAAVSRIIIGFILWIPVLIFGAGYYCL